MFQYIQFRFFGTIAKEAAISAADAKPAMHILFRGRLVGWLGGWVDGFAMDPALCRLAHIRCLAQDIPCISSSTYMLFTPG